jgi:hypothetical protein
MDARRESDGGSLAILDRIDASISGIGHPQTQARRHIVPKDNRTMHPVHRLVRIALVREMGLSSYTDVQFY